MKDKTIEIVINKENWQKVALAVGDINPIHYLENEAVCPGVYLFSEVEKIAREDGRFQPPLNIKGKFFCGVYDKDKLILNKNYLENKSIFTYFKYNDKIVEFEFEKISECKKNHVFTGKLEEAREILESELYSFNEALGITGNKEVYSAFTVGRVLEKFLIGREGSLLQNIEFDHYKDPILGNLFVKLDINKEIRKRGRKEITDFFIRAEVIQFNGIIGAGFGKIQHKIVRRD
ncbi:MAG: hypothetical protein AABW90_00085 [Nanoarchaeota archaeon]